MENQFRYSFADYHEHGKLECPLCHQKSLVRYVDNLTNELLPDDIGKCDHSVHCCYHYTPYDFCRDNGIPFESLTPGEPCISGRVRQSSGKFHTIKSEVLEKTLENPVNSFTQYLLEYLDNDFERLQQLVKMYRLGTRHTSVVFWEIDKQQRIRTGKIMTYDSQGHRIKDCIWWVHSRYKDFRLKQCLFGEHLLSEYPERETVYIVESQKTAVMLATHWKFKDSILMATGGLQELTPGKFEVFRGIGKTIILLPDVGQEELWYNKALQIKERYSLNLGMYASNYFIEEHLKDNYKLDKGQDLADYLDYKHRHIDPIFTEEMRNRFKEYSNRGPQ